ncbi:hypothetical protein E5K00_14830 [Hymenobacter aquaticus]|uniref:Uncharacterized protein n=1 Tax=Hymenobacter aquaticus TaxID=1867101 RepID=A0A4Z0PVN6_9BACT|nr:hypothetical protein [Hymenobacter aquaticus]TGE21555.1 hypothetical protein E5K00_14830 [Hymenobacter aquaticus]
MLSTSNALAQQSRSKSAKTPATPAPAAAPAAEPVATPAPDPAATSGFAAPASAMEANPQSNGFAIAPGFTAAPSHRVRMDYRGRPLAPYVKRNVSVNTTAPAPMVEATPVSAPAEPAVTTTEVAAPVAAPASKSASASATKKVSSAGAAPAAAAAPKKAPAKKAPAKKADDGWGSSGSGW